MTARKIIGDLGTEGKEGKNALTIMPDGDTLIPSVF